MKQYPSNLFGSILFFAVFLSEEGSAQSGDRAESSSAQSRIIRYENITKGAKDKRSYRGLKLENDFKILLVSSSNLYQASVAMSINVGSLNDFDELPGIAYLVGEMVNRSGTSSNPEQEFVDIINSRLPEDVLGPVKFPETKEGEQQFYFDISPTYLIPALKIFAELFNEPLLMTSNSVNPLQACIQHLDWWQASLALGEGGNKWHLSQLLKSISLANHPFNHSPRGNTELFNKYLAEHTYGESETNLDQNLEPRQTMLHDKIREFYSTWYSSNLMCLVVVGEESLDQLEQVVVPLFETIPNKNVEKLHFSYEQHPWGQEQLQRKIFSTFSATLFRSQESVRLVFRVPDIRRQYKTGPEIYVKYILMRGGPGSLKSLLDKRGLCAYFKAAYDVKLGIGFFTIKCTVPTDHEIDEDEIVKLTMQYIRYIKKDGIHKWIFEENILREKLIFSNTHYTTSAISIASAMHEYPMEDLLSYKYHQTEWKPALIEEFLAYLTPDNMNIFIDSKKFQDEVVEQNTWHKIPYKVEKISDQLIESWKNVDWSPDSQILGPNEFLTESVDIHPLIKNEPENPYVVHESPRSRFWFLQNNRSAFVRIVFNLIDLKGRPNPPNTILFCILTRMLSNLMNEHSHALSASWFDWSFIHNENYVNIYLSGYSDKIQIVLKKIMSKINMSQLTGSHLQEQFRAAKMKCIDEEKKHKNSPIAMNHLNYALSESGKRWSPAEIAAASQSLQFRDWNKFVSKILSRMYIQGLIVGNCVKQSAIDITKIIEMPFGSSGKRTSQEMLSLLPRVVEIEKGKHFVDIVFKDTDEEFHVQSIYYQFGTGTSQNTIIYSLLIDLIKTRCSDLIPGDILAQYYGIKIYGVIGLLFYTVSTYRNANEVDLLFENCLRNVYVSLQEMTNNEFYERVKEAIENELDTSPIVWRYWDKIVTGFYNFESDINELTEDMRSLTKMDVLTFFEDTLHEFSPKRRKLTILTFPRNSDWTSLSVIPGATKIEDLTTFKNDSNLLPLPYPFMRVNFF